MHNQGLTAADWPAVGVYYDLPPELYYVPEKGVASKSLLMHILRSPAHYRAVLDGYGEDTQDLAIGRAAHVALLEPEKFDAAYVVPRVEPKWPDLRLKENKHLKEERDAWRATEAARCAGKIELTQANYDSIFGMREALARHKARSMFEDGWAEVTIRYVDPRTGLTCKSRLDHLSFDGIIADLKSTKDARPGPRHFGKSIAEYTYDAQAAFYLDGCRQVDVDADQFVFVAIEKAKPHGISWGDISSGDIDVGREIYRDAMDRLAHCVQHDAWPAYSDEFVRYELPRWRR